MKANWFGLATLVLAAVALAGGARADSLGCALNALSAPAFPHHYPAVALGPASPEEVRAQTQIAINRTGAPVSPAYTDLPRIDAAFIVNGQRHVTIAAVLDGVTPNKGDAVVIASRYRDPNTPCSFIPWTVVPAARAVLRGAGGRGTFG